MSENWFNPNWAAKVIVPVRRVGKYWEFYYGGDVPVKDGAVGELVLTAGQITDQGFLRRITQELSVRILDEETSLLIALSDRSVEHRGTANWPNVREGDVPAGATRFERVTLGPLPLPIPEPPPGTPKDERGGLWLKLKGLDRSELHGSTVLMPAGFQPTEAISLNHAYTLLSSAYETHRISNTGNVYTRVFYEDSDQRWYPLDDLRRGVQAAGERTLLKELWAEVERRLGWRPLPRAPRGKRK